MEGVRKCADHGAGAIVLKSLFEEQLMADVVSVESHSAPFVHPEALEYITQVGMEYGPNHYLKLIETAKKSVSTPIIASLNCVSASRWTEYAKRIENAGADGLELNITVMPSDPKRSTGTAEDIEEIYFRIIEEVKRQVKIPIALKMGPHFTLLARFAEKLSWRGVSALVLFNRFYQFDIDIEKMVLTTAHPFSTPGEMHHSLRWISLLSGKVKCDLCASTGIHDGKAVIKQLLAGATAVQVCSTLYIHGFEVLSRIRNEVEDWMKTHHHTTIDDFRGKLSRLNSANPADHERLQYIRALVHVE
ncbi:MAG: dihydroorotate dehydrogenase-like protein [Desulfomicrobium escambiense]|nr:dihydroorotate dehydrogenase-like protein [Desulfomicrobium escambiense]